MWIKFVDSIPNDCSNVCLSCQGIRANNWVSECKPNEWKHVSVTIVNDVGFGDK